MVRSGGLLRYLESSGVFFEEFAVEWDVEGGRKRSQEWFQGF